MAATWHVCKAVRLTFTKNARQMNLPGARVVNDSCEIPSSECLVKSTALLIFSFTLLIVNGYYSCNDVTSLKCYIYCIYK